MPLTSNAAGVAPGCIEHDRESGRDVAQEAIGVGAPLVDVDARRSMRPSPRCRSWSAFIHGNERRHGAHHEAQKST